MARRTAAPADDGCRYGKHLPPLVLKDGSVWMAWTTHRVEITGQRPSTGRCRICDRNTIMRDCSGAWCHKTCAEQEAARDLALAGIGAA